MKNAAPKVQLRSPGRSSKMRVSEKTSYQDMAGAPCGG